MGDQVGEKKQKSFPIKKNLAVIRKHYWQVLLLLRERKQERKK